MMARGITVTNEDLENFRKLLRLFLIGAIKTRYSEEPSEDKFLPTLLRHLDGHFFLEEPFISGQITMVNAGADNGTLVISDEHFEAYKAVALFNIKEHFANVKPGTIAEPEEFQRALDSAIITQMRLASVLDEAEHMTPGQLEPGEQPDKQYMN
jgi:hypothetical protein